MGLTMDKPDVRTRLSVNLNKVALIRNSRDTTIPSVLEAARTAINAGARGITVHPRPDMRHIRPGDVRDLAGLLAQTAYQDIEFNIEGNPYAEAEANGFPGFMALVEQAAPHQCTLVPDDPSQLTSDHGWRLGAEADRLKPLVESLQKQKIRVSLFMDPVHEEIERAAALGVDRIELYTGPYAAAWGTDTFEQVLDSFAEAAKFAQSLHLGVNAGHDLDLDNLGIFCSRVPNVAEVSIGHALISDAIWLGLETTVRKYRQILDDIT